MYVEVQIPQQQVYFEVEMGLDVRPCAFYTYKRYKLRIYVCLVCIYVCRVYIDMHRVCLDPIYVCLVKIA